MDGALKNDVMISYRKLNEKYRTSMCILQMISV